MCPAQIQKIPNALAGQHGHVDQRAKHGARSGGLTILSYHGGGFDAVHFFVADVAVSGLIAHGRNSGHWIGPWVAPASDFSKPKDGLQLPATARIFRILAAMQSKQIFLSFDEAKKFGPDVEQLLKRFTVLKLAHDDLLYIKDWRTRK